MFLKTPYISIVFYMMLITGIVINIFSVIKISNIFALFGYDMFLRPCLWLKEVKIFLISFYVYNVLLMTYNLMIGFRSTAIVSLNRTERFYCLDSSIIQKILYLVNHLTFIFTFALTLIVTIIVFIFATLKALCVDGSNVPRTYPLDPYKMGYNPGEIGQYLDLRGFQPLVGLRSNETIYLYFANDRLKRFCDDYVSILYVYNLIFFASSILVVYAMFNIIVTYSFNMSRNCTKKKLQELIFLNSNELSALNSN